MDENGSISIDTFLRSEPLVNFGLLWAGWSPETILRESKTLLQQPSRANIAQFYDALCYNWTQASIPLACTEALPSSMLLLGTIFDANPFMVFNTYAPIGLIPLHRVEVSPWMLRFPLDYVTDTETICGIQRRVDLVFS
jgi:hypothetical protein